MKRVHGYESPNSSSDSPPEEQRGNSRAIRKRKGAGPAGSTEMKRQSSSQAKARAASASYSRDQYQVAVAQRQTRYARNQVLGQMEDVDSMEDVIPMPNAQFHQVNIYPHQSQQFPVYDTYNPHQYVTAY